MGRGANLDQVSMDRSCARGCPGPGDDLGDESKIYITHSLFEFVRAQATIVHTQTCANLSSL
eukprot:COSAG02_NODE_1208_length_13883_cov_54.757998_9_plen_62_part_00